MVRHLLPGCQCCDWNRVVRFDNSYRMMGKPEKAYYHPPTLPTPTLFCHDFRPWSHPLYSLFVVTSVIFSTLFPGDAGEGGGGAGSLEEGQIPIFFVVRAPRALPRPWTTSRGL